jgi:hypothetical protein
MVSVFGEKGLMTGVPPFLDDALAPARIELSRAAKGEVKVEKALTVRALKDALSLVLKGKNHPNFLRRLYPVGLSAETAKEIMLAFINVIRTETRKTRLITGCGFTFLAALFFGGLFLTPLFKNIVTGWNPVLIRLILIVMPVAAIAKSWFVLRIVGRWELSRRFNTKDIGPALPVGRIGYATFAGVFLIYLLVLSMAGLLF